MPELPSLTSEKSLRFARKKGLYRIELRDQVYYNPETKKCCSSPQKELPKGTRLEILKQAGISIEELKELL